MAPKALTKKALKKNDRDEFGQPQHNHGMGTVGDLIKIFLATRLGYSEGQATWQSLIIFLKKKLLLLTRTRLLVAMYPYGSGGFSMAQNIHAHLTSCLFFYHVRAMARPLST
jgi:hypothetical protein